MLISVPRAPFTSDQFKKNKAYWATVLHPPYFFSHCARTMGMCFRMLQRAAQMLLLGVRLHELECFERRCTAWTKVLHKNLLK